jgi:hypothetical protein
MLSAGVEKAGSTHKLGHALGLAQGSWIWRLQNGKAQGLPSPLLVVKLARYVGVDPFAALRAFGHSELVDLLSR